MFYNESFVQISVDSFFESCFSWRVKINKDTNHAQSFSQQFITNMIGLEACTVY